MCAARRVTSAANYAHHPDASVLVQSGPSHGFHDPEVLVSPGVWDEAETAVEGNQPCFARTQAGIRGKRHRPAGAIRRVDRLPIASLLKRWTKRPAPALRVQAAWRAEIPPVYSNGALESALGQIRATIAPRAFSYRNQSRTNQMLALYRLTLLRADDVLNYASDIRTHIVDHRGHPPTPGLPRHLRPKGSRQQPLVESHAAKDEGSEGETRCSTANRRVWWTIGAAVKSRSSR